MSLFEESRPGRITTSPKYSAGKEAAARASRKSYPVVYSTSETRAGQYLTQVIDGQEFTTFIPEGTAVKVQSDQGMITLASGSRAKASGSSGSVVDVSKVELSPALYNKVISDKYGSQAPVQRAVAGDRYFARSSYFERRDQARSDVMFRKADIIMNDLRNVQVNVSKPEKQRFGITQSIVEAGQGGAADFLNPDVGFGKSMAGFGLAAGAVLVGGASSVLEPPLYALFGKNPSQEDIFALGFIGASMTDLPITPKVKAGWAMEDAQKDFVFQWGEKGSNRIDSSFEWSLKSFDIKGRKGAIVPDLRIKDPITGEYSFMASPYGQKNAPELQMQLYAKDITSTWKDPQSLFAPEPYTPFAALSKDQQWVVSKEKGFIFNTEFQRTLSDFKFEKAVSSEKTISVFKQESIIQGKSFSLDPLSASIVSIYQERSEIFAGFRNVWDKWKPGVFPGEVAGGDSALSSGSAGGFVFLPGLTGDLNFGGSSPGRSSMIDLPGGVDVFSESGSRSKPKSVVGLSSVSSSDLRGDQRLSFDFGFDMPSPGIPTGDFDFGFEPPEPEKPGKKNGFKLPKFKGDSVFGSSKPLIPADFSPDYVSSVEANVFDVFGSKPSALQIRSGLFLRPKLR